ncbi:MAG: DUF790 family protein [Planctomycetes bacterium]|nr:DUF790 family protein [Planctomycetota bacterium]
MLSRENLRVTVNGGTLRPAFLSPGRTEHTDLAAELLRLVAGSVGRTRGEIDEGVGALAAGVRAPRAAHGLWEVLAGASRFATADPGGAAGCRRTVFAAAAGARAAGRFDRARVLAESAVRLGVPAVAVEDALYADLPSQDRLEVAADLDPIRLLERYNVRLVQGVLHSCVGFEAEADDDRPDTYQRLFAGLKENGLPFEAVSRREGNCRLRVAGPHSPTRRFGSAVARFFPALLSCREWRLASDLVWGKGRRHVRLVLSHEDGPGTAAV